MQWVPSGFPTPPTAGDFYRRYSQVQLMRVMQGINRVRQKVSKQQEDSKGKWGYHPLVITLAETQEPRYLINGGGCSAY